MKKILLIAVLFAACGLAHAQCPTSGVGAIGGVGTWQCGLGVIVTGLENVYCPKGVAPDYTEQTSPLWGATDDFATLPQKCMYTGLDATPSPGNGYTPASSATLVNVLASAGGSGVNADGTSGGSQHLACGDTILLTAGNSYSGTTGAPPQLVFPFLACDGSHWITVKSTGVSNALFPGEGVRATPCIAGLSNDAVNGRQLPGYPDYACASFPAVLTAQILQPANSLSPAFTFAKGANHYRFIGIEIAKNQTVSVDQLVPLAADGLTLGAHHIIFDRVVTHGDKWLPTSGKETEAQNGISMKNSQWVAVINSSVYDTYCNSSCVDSHAVSGGTGLYQDGPFKLYNNLLASAAEPFIFGGGGQGPGTPNTAHAEIRSNHSFHPLTWMVQVNNCPFLYEPVPKNLGEFKAMTFALVEGNVFENNWQGCQSDQSGFGMLLDPVSQNNHKCVNVTLDGSMVATVAAPTVGCAGTSFTHDTQSSPTSGNPIDAANCPPGGCVLNDTVNNVDYRFCNGMNGCDQSGIANLKCGTGTKAGLACTNDGQCTSDDGAASYCAPTTSARITTATVPGTVAANACVPGSCPDCKNKDVTFRFNEIYNTTNGLEINAGLSSICHDQAGGMAQMSIHDNHLHGLSRDMSNGKTPYSGSTAFILSNNSLPPAVSNRIGIRHNSVAIEEGSQGGVSGFGNQVDHTDSQYLEKIAYTDNVGPASMLISRSSGTSVTKGGLLGASGLANTYTVNACQRYFTAEIPNGTVPAKNPDGTPFVPPQDFTFVGLPTGGTNYFISYNGQWTAITLQTATSFRITATVKAGDTINVRDLNDCDWTFASNVLGAGTSGLTGVPPGSPWYGSPGLSPNFFGSGQAQDPYPNQNSDFSKPLTCGGGGTGNTLNCILDETQLQGVFTNQFTSWLTGRNGIYTIANGSPFRNWASDQADRSPTGKAPGADFGLLAAKLAGVRGTTFLPPLTISTTSLGGTAGQALNAQLAATFGASQFWSGYKSWWAETIQTACTPSGLTPACGSLNNGSAHSGLVISRGGIVNGPIPILSVSRTGCTNVPQACLSNYTLGTTITGGVWEVGQTVSLAQFLDAGGTGPDNQDGQFNGVCTITAVTSNSFSCRQTGDIAGTNSNKAGHAPNGPTGTPMCGVNNNSKCDSTASFAPKDAGTYTFWVGVRDGAFQVARGQITVVITGNAPPPPVNYRPTTFTDSSDSPVSSPTLAFDNNLATRATGLSSNDGTNQTFYDITYKGFPARTGGVPSAVALYVVSDSFTSGTFGSTEADYSLNGGVNWTVLWSGLNHGTAGNPVTDSVAIPVNQDFTKVQVRFQNTGCGLSPCSTTGQFYETWIAATP